MATVSPNSNIPVTQVSGSGGLTPDAGVVAAFNSKLLQQNAPIGRLQTAPLMLAQQMPGQFGESPSEFRLYSSVKYKFLPLGSGGNLGLLWHVSIKDQDDNVVVAAEEILSRAVADDGPGITPPDGHDVVHHMATGTAVNLVTTDGSFSTNGTLGEIINTELNDALNGWDKRHGVNLAEVAVYGKAIIQNADKQSRLSADVPKEFDGQRALGEAQEFKRLEGAFTITPVDKGTLHIKSTGVIDQAMSYALRNMLEANPQTAKELSDMRIRMVKHFSSIIEAFKRGAQKFNSTSVELTPQTSRLLIEAYRSGLQIALLRLEDTPAAQTLQAHIRFYNYLLGNADVLNMDDVPDLVAREKSKVNKGENSNGFLGRIKSLFPNLGRADSDLQAQSGQTHNTQGQQQQQGPGDRDFSELQRQQLDQQQQQQAMQRQFVYSPQQSQQQEQKDMVLYLEPPALTSKEKQDFAFFSGAEETQKKIVSTRAELNWASMFNASGEVKNQNDAMLLYNALQIHLRSLHLNYSLFESMRLYTDASKIQHQAITQYNENFLPAFKSRMMSGQQVAALIKPGALLTSTADDMQYDKTFRKLIAHSASLIKEGESIKSGLEYIGYHAKAYNQHKQGLPIEPDSWRPFGDIAEYNPVNGLENTPAEYFGKLKPVLTPVYQFIDPDRSEPSYLHATTAEAQALIDGYGDEGRYPLVLQAYGMKFDFGFVDIRNEKAQIAHGHDLGLRSKVRLGLDRAFSEVINTSLPLEQRVKAAITFRLLADITHAYWRGNVPISTHAGVGLLAMLGVPSGPEAPHFEVRAFMHGSRGNTNLNTFIEQETQAAMQRYHQLQNTSVDTPGQQPQQGIDGRDLTEIQKQQQEQQLNQQRMQRQFVGSPQQSQQAQQAQQGPVSSSANPDPALVDAELKKVKLTDEVKQEARFLYLGPVAEDPRIGIAVATESQLKERQNNQALLEQAGLNPADYGAQIFGYRLIGKNKYHAQMYAVALSYMPGESLYNEMMGHKLFSSDDLNKIGRTVANINWGLWAKGLYIPGDEIHFGNVIVARDQHGQADAVNMIDLNLRALSSPVTYAQVKRLIDLQKRLVVTFMSGKATQQFQDAVADLHRGVGNLSPPYAGSAQNHESLKASLIEVAGTLASLDAEIRGGFQVIVKQLIEFSGVDVAALPGLSDEVKQNLGLVESNSSEPSQLNAISGLTADEFKALLGNLADLRQGGLPDDIQQLLEARQQELLRDYHIDLPLQSVADELLLQLFDSGEQFEFLHARYQKALRTAVFNDLDEFTRQEGFRDLAPLERYRTIYERYRLDLHPLSILDAIAGHVDLTGDPDNPFPDTVNALIKQLPTRSLLEKARKALRHFFHELHLLEGNPDDSIDITNLRSQTTVLMYPSWITDLGNAGQAADLYSHGVVLGALKSLTDVSDPSPAMFGFLNGGSLPGYQVIENWRQTDSALGIYHTVQDQEDFAQFLQLGRSILYGSAGPGLTSEYTERARNILKTIMQRNFPDVTAADLQHQFVVGEAVRRANGGDIQHPNAAGILAEHATHRSIAAVVKDLWVWADTTQMPDPDTVEQIYNEIQQNNEYPVSIFEDSASVANLVYAYYRGELAAKSLVAELLELFSQEVATASPVMLNGETFINSVLARLPTELLSGDVETKGPGLQSDSVPSDTGPTTDSLSGQVSSESSNALEEQYESFAESNALFNLTDQQSHSGYTNFSFHTKVESGAGTIGVVPYDLPELLSGQGGDLTTPVETGEGQATQTEYTPAHTAPATISTGNTTPAESLPEARLEQTVRNAYSRLPAAVQTTLTLDEFRQLDLTEIDLAQQYKDYVDLHQNVTHQDDKPPMRLVDYIKFGLEIQQRLQQWSDQANRSDVAVNAYKKQAQLYRDQAESLQQVTQQIQLATAALKVAQSEKLTQSAERITIPSRYPPAQIIQRQGVETGNVSNNIINTTKTGAPIGGKVSTNVPMISLKGKTGLGQYSQSSTIPKYLYKPNQQGHLQLHVVVESGNQLSLQAVPLNVHKPQVSMGTHYTPESGWRNIPQLNATQQNQINQYLQQSTFMMPSPVMAPTAPAGSSAPAPVPVPVP